MSIEIRIPDIGEGVESVQLIKMLVKPGDSITVDQPVAELETGKAIVEVPSSGAGRVAKVLIRDGSDVKPGDVMLELEGDSPAAEPPTTAAKASAPGKAQPREAVTSVSSPTPGDSRRVVASPSVRRMARELGVDIGSVDGSGPHKRITRDDVKSAVRAAGIVKAPAPAAAHVAPLPDFSKWGGIRNEKMTAIRRQTAAHLWKCWTQIPHVTVHDKADITELEPLRKKYAALAEAKGGKLTMAVMVTKTVASALRRFPKMNASVDMENGTIVFKEYCNVGIAVATDRGLVVPVIHDADRKNMVELAAEISAIAEKARTGKLLQKEMEGGTFTVTNLGRVGGEYFTPIINHPEVGILGMGRYSVESDPHGGKPRTFLPLSLSFDHRLVDGAEGAEFLSWIIEALREPLLLSLQG